MGNRALRKQVGLLLKEQGLGKLYYGNKRQIYRSLRAYHLRKLLFVLSLKPGDLVNDCDAFNHRFVKFVYPFHQSFRGGNRVFVCDQVEFENGHWSCGCPTSPCPPYTIEQIEEFHKSQLLDPEREAFAREGGWWNSSDQKMKEALQKGEPICDSDGIVLNHFIVKGS